jgi:hypothetical protein
MINENEINMMIENGNALSMKLISLLKSVGKGDLKSQIDFIDEFNNIFKTPVGLAIKNSLTELYNIKKHIS